MTEKKANEILRTKYPNAKIYKRNGMGGTSSSCLAVTFTPDGKVYDYQASSYQVVLQKLGFKVLYKHDVTNYENRIKVLNTYIQDGGRKGLNLFTHDNWYTFSAEEIKSMSDEIEELTKEIQESIIV